MTDLQVMLYALMITAVGALVLFLVYRACLMVVEWREHD